MLIHVYDNIWSNERVIASSVFKGNHVHCFSESLDRNLFTTIISFHYTHQLNPLEQRKRNLDVSFHESFNSQNQHSKVEFIEWYFG